MDDHGIAATLAQQDGAISRRQLRSLGASPHDVQRLTRRRLLTRIHPGVYLEHTGPPSWRQRAWAGVLALWPAALCAESAVYDEPATGDDGRPIHIAVARDRRVVTPHGVRVHRMAGLHERVWWNRCPPRVRYPDAVVDVAARARSEFAAFEVLAQACRDRRTTPQRLADALTQRSRVSRRAWLSAVLADLTAGTTSVLERGYVTAVEQAHGLPRAARQVRATASLGVVYRDAEYAAGLLVELDGRLVHNMVPQRDADLERDLDAALDGRTTVRLSWGQVFDRPCSTALKIALLLRGRGWTEAPWPSGRSCPVGDAADLERSIRRTW